MPAQLRLNLKKIDFSTLCFEPKPDISTFELAQALSVLVRYQHPALTVEDAFSRLPEDVRRHFKYRWVKI
jgi:hypothetical protein